MKCPRCNNEFADGLKNCPYCGLEITQNNSTNEESSVPKFAASLNKANPRVRNQKEAIKKINEVNRIPDTKDDGVYKEKPVVGKQSEKTIPVKTIVADVEQTDKLATTAAPVTAKESTPVDKKPLTKEDLIAMQKKVDERIAEQEKDEYIEERVDTEESSYQDDIDEENERKSEEGAKTVKSSKRGLFRRKNKFKEKQKEKEEELFPEESSEVEESDWEDEEDKYDVNIDGYYDDLIPELAHQINKIPQENIIKVVFIVIFIIILCFIILYTSQ